MKTITQTKQVEETVYCCDQCDYTSEFEWHIDHHMAKTHDVKQIKTIDDVHYIYLETEESAKRYLKYNGVVSMDDCISWTGPNWYVKHLTSINPHYPYCNLISCDAFFKILQTQSDQLLKQIENARWELATNPAIFAAEERLKMYVEGKSKETILPTIIHGSEK